MHSSHASFVIRELHRHELLDYAEQQRLLKLACTSTPCARPHEAMAMAILAFVHGLTAYRPLAFRERPPVARSAAAPDLPPLTAPPG